MNIEQKLLCDVLNCLASFDQDKSPPSEASTRLRYVQSLYPTVELQLIWEKELYDNSIHYDVLIRTEDRTTVSLSVCTEDALPWPLRSVHRWSETDLLKVNGTVLRVEQAIACLDFIWDEAPLVNRLINLCLIQEEFNKDPIEITDDELQQGIDGFRRKYKLYTMETTHQWLEARGMSHAQLERVVTDNLAISKLRGRIAEGREDAYFEAHRSDFDTAFVAQIECASAERAEFLYQQLLRHETEFLEVALDCIRSDVAQYGKQTYPVFLNLLRGQAPEGFSGIFSAKPGDLVSPFSSSDRYIVARVVSVTRGTLSESTRALIQERLFDEWLAERRRTAKIVWCWGNSERTS